MFPVTRHSVIASAASGDADARRDGFGLFVEAYWRPIMLPGGLVGLVGYTTYKYAEPRRPGTV